MIWTRGELVADDALAVSVLDRTFEHGLGLFETLRTWNGRTTLLHRHLDRLCRSAEALGLPLNPAELPDHDAVNVLRRADGLGEGDRVIRITASGGTTERNSSRVWMRTLPLPAEPPPGGVRLGVIQTIAPGNPLDRHKSLNYWWNRVMHEAARSEGCDEVLLATPDGQIWQGSRTNLFLVRDGRLTTPGPHGPFLSGILRETLLLNVRRWGIEVCEEPIDRDRLAEADEVFLTNSVRGIIPVGCWEDRAWTAPGPWTHRLQRRLGEWLERAKSPARDEAPRPD